MAGELEDVPAEPGDLREAIRLRAGGVADPPEVDRLDSLGRQALDRGGLARDLDRHEQRARPGGQRIAEDVEVRGEPARDALEVPAALRDDVRGVEAREEG